MNLVDSCAWLEYFADGPNAGFYAPAIASMDTLIVPSICLLEVFKRILQQRDEHLALQAIAVMQQGVVIDLDAELALSAGRLGSEYKLPLADAVILATARSRGAILWTQDAHFESIEGVRYVQAGGKAG